MAKGESRRRILRTIPSYFPYVTGPANQARESAVRLGRHGYCSTLVTSNSNAAAAPARETVAEGEIVRLPVRAGFMQYQITAGAWPALSSAPADVIHAHCYRNYLADAAAIVARRRRIPFVLQLHGTLSGFRKIVSPDRHWLYQAYDQLFGLLPTLGADRIIVSTNEEAHEAAQHGIDPTRIRVIPMGVTPEAYSFSALPRDYSQLLFVGRISEDRNVDLLIQALGRLTDLSWTCRIVGGEERRSYANREGYVDRLRKIAMDLSIMGRVQFTGPLYGAALRRAYAEAGVFVYPSRYENFGQTILEAAAAGCALVTTRVGVANDLITEDVSGVFIEEREVERLAANLRALLQHPEQQREYGAAVLAQVRRLYSWEPIVRAYERLYDEIIDERGSMCSMHSPRRVDS